MRSFILWVLAFAALAVQAQDLDNLSLGDMLDMQSTIATKRSLSTRESPGIVSIVTREEIERSSARDLMEILNMHVPGIYSGTDIEGAAGIGIRGIWGFDSRMLLMLDGIELNEEVFGSMPLGNRYPAEMIDRVEVIRGPGSVIYGGYGTIGVINVVSRASAMNGVSVGGRYSATSKSVANQNLTLSGGQKFENFRYDITVSGGEGNRGEGLYEDGLGNSTSMTDRTNLNPQLYALGFTAGGLQVRGLVDKLSTTHVHHGWNPVTGINYAETFDTYAAQAQYAIQLGSSFRLIPKYDFKLTEPWNIMDEDPLNTWESRKKSTRHRGALHADWDITPDLRLLSGIEYSSLVVDHQRDSILDKEGRIKNEFRTIFSEASLATVAGRFSLGARYEDSSLVDPAFVPRLAWTKAWNRFHLKAMDSTSFRSPAGIQPAPTRTFAGETLKPEIATTAEIEAGYRLSSQSTLVGNVFDMKVEDALVYETRGAVGAYSNLGTIGSRGAEAEYRFKGEKLDVNTSVAYYRSIATSVPSVQVPNEDGMNRAAPTLRVNLHPGYRFSQEFGIFPSAQYYSERWGLASDGTVKSFDPVVIVNANLRYMPAAVKGLQVTGGVMNLTDADLPLLQGYDNGVAEMNHDQMAYNFMVNYEIGF